MRPLTDSVSRTRQEFAAMVSTTLRSGTRRPTEQPTLPNDDPQVANSRCPAPSRNRSEACLGRNDWHELPRASRGAAPPHRP